MTKEKEERCGKCGRICCDDTAPVETPEVREATAEAHAHFDDLLTAPYITQHDLHLLNERIERTRAIRVVFAPPTPVTDPSLREKAIAEAHEALDERIRAAARRIRRNATEGDIGRNELAIDALEMAIFAAARASEEAK